MSLAHGRPHLAIPGPSVIPDRVLQAMHRPAPNIYEGALVEMVESIVPDLRAVARTTGEAAIYIGNGHAAWEAALANVLSEGDRVLVLNTGRFGPGWGEMAEALGAGVDTLELGLTGPVDYGRIETALRAGPAYRAVLAVFVDTSTGLMIDIASVRAAMTAAGSGALLMADCIASLGCDRFDMDASGADVMVTGCQKGLMTPPGLAFVFFNARAAEVRAGLPRVSRYWDWRPRTEPEGFYQYFCGTAPTHHLFGLRAALDMILEEGLEAIWTRHERLARAVWAACEAWGSEGPLRLNVPQVAERSRAVTSIGLGPGQGEALRRWCEREAGVTLGIGLGREPGDAWFRIGHMGHLNAHMVLGTLGVIEAGLQATGVPHGGGALAAAAAECV